MDLLKHIEPMKHLPDGFSNLAFWRGVRKLKDEMINAFEYINIWGASIEHKLDDVPTKMVSVASIPTYSIKADSGGAKLISGNDYGFYVKVTGKYPLCTIPANAIGVRVTCHICYDYNNTKYMITPVEHNLYSIENGKLNARWTGNSAVFYDPALTSENYTKFTNPYLIYDFVFSLSQ